MTNPLQFPKGLSNSLKDIAHEDKLPDSFVNQRKANQPIVGTYLHSESLYEIQVILQKISGLSDTTSLEHIFSADAFCLTLNREEEDIIIRTVNKYGSELIFNHNCDKINRMIKFIISTCPIINVKPQISNSVSNALFFTQKIIKLMLNSLYFNQLIAQLDGLNSEINIMEQIIFSDNKRDKPQYFVFVDWLIEVIVYMEIESIESINFYHQVLVTLLTLVSHDSYSLEDSYVLNYIINNHGHNAKIIINRCLSLYFNPKSPEVYSLTGMVSYAYSCLFARATTKQWIKEQQTRLDFQLKSPHYPNTLSYLAVHLISLLCFTNAIDNQNPFMKVFENYFDNKPQTKAELKSQELPPAWDISQVYYIITPNLHIEETSVLFYLFLINSEFINYCCSVAEPDKLIIPIIKLIYESAIQNNNLAHCHILLPTLLTFCNDSLYIESLQKTMIPKQAWFQERLFRPIPLCELIMFVVIKVFNINLVEIKNQFIHSLSLSCIASLGKQLHNIHPLLVQKIISLVDIGCKNLLKYGQSNRDRDDKLEGIKIFEEIIYIILITINTIVAKGLPSSSQFVYGLLLRNDKLLQLQSHPLISPIVDNLLAVVSYYQCKLSEVDSQLMTADELMIKIHEIPKAYNINKNKCLPVLNIRYVQIKFNYNFWKMYIWILIELRVPVLVTDQLIKNAIQLWWS